MSTVTLYPQQDAAACASILVVDDNEMNRDLLARRLQRDGHDIMHARHGREALDLLDNVRIDLILLDVMMPVMDGIQTLEAIRQDPRHRHIPVIMITAVHETESAVTCIEHGADDYIHKPFNPSLLRARVNASLDRKRCHDAQQRRFSATEQHNQLLQGRVNTQIRELSSAQMATIFAMSKLAESKDPDTGEHLERMREYCVILSRELERLPRYAGAINKAFHDNLYAASPLHDIGKVGIPDRILLKPGRLTPQEWVVMRTHPVIGGQTLREVDRQYPGNAFLHIGIDIAECHHEKWDGTGYPHGLKGEEIPLVARILALGDVYDALTSKRCYKEAFGHDESRDMILQLSGRHFDPDVIQAFVDREDEFIQVRKFFAGSVRRDRS